MDNKLLPREFMKLKQSPPSAKWSNPSPYRLGGRGAKNLTAIFAQSDQTTPKHTLFTPEPSEKFQRKYYLYEGTTPCFVQLVSDAVDIFVQSLKPNPTNLDLLLPCEGHVWSANQDLLYPVKMISKSDGLELIADAHVQSFVYSIHSNLHHSFPRNIVAPIIKPSPDMDNMVKDHDMDLISLSTNSDDSNGPDNDLLTDKQSSKLDPPSEPSIEINNHNTMSMCGRQQDPVETPLTIPGPSQPTIITTTDISTQPTQTVEVMNESEDSFFQEMLQCASTDDLEALYDTINMLSAPDQVQDSILPSPKNIFSPLPTTTNSHKIPSKPPLPKKRPIPDLTIDLQTNQQTESTRPLLSPIGRTLFDPLDSLITTTSKQTIPTTNIQSHSTILASPRASPIASNTITNTVNTVLDASYLSPSISVLTKHALDMRRKPPRQPQQLPKQHSQHSQQQPQPGVVTEMDDRDSVSSVDSGTSKVYHDGLYTPQSICPSTIMNEAQESERSDVFQKIDTFPMSLTMEESHSGKSMTTGDSLMDGKLVGDDHENDDNSVSKEEGAYDDENENGNGNDSDTAYVMDYWNSLNTAAALTTQSTPTQTNITSTTDFESVGDSSGRRSSVRSMAAVTTIKKRKRSSNSSDTTGGNDGTVNMRTMRSTRKRKAKPTTK